MAVDMSETDVEAEEPLLNLPVALTPIQQHGSLVTASLITEDDRSGHTHNEANRQLLLLRMLGQPYAAKTSFWTKAWPLSLNSGGDTWILDWRLHNTGSSPVVPLVCCPYVEKPW
jgi:hypothetical protein